MYCKKYFYYFYLSYLKFFIMFIKNIFLSVDQFESNELEPLVFKAGDDATNEAPLHPVRLDHDVGALLLVGHPALSSLQQF